MIQRTNQLGRSWYIVFFLLPVAALISAIRNFRVPAAKNILWFFTVFYGFTFVISSDSLDSSRYRGELLKLYDSPVTSFGQFISLLYSNEAEYVDVLQPVVTFVLSRFTNDYRILFATFGLIFGYFYSRNIWTLLSFARDRIRPQAVPFIVLFALVITIWHINGFRFWTAAQIFLFGFFNVHFYERKWRGWMFCGLSVFVHFSFLFPFLLFIIFSVVGNRLVLLFLLYFSSFFVAKVTPQVFVNFIPQLPAVIQGRTDKYLSSEYEESLAKAKKKQINWYVTGRVTALQYTVVLLLIIVFAAHRRSVAENILWSSLLCFGLLLSTWVNLLGSIPSVGRFNTVSYLFIFSFLFLLTQASPRRVFSSWVQAIVLSAALLYCIVEVRRGFDTVGLYTVIGNPFLAIFVDNEIPLIDLIR